jgi:NTE family protein
MASSPQLESADLHALLGASASFGALDDAVRSTLASTMHAQAVAPGQVLLRQGEIGDALYVIAQGQFEVRLQRPDGTDALIDTVGRGEVIGEMQLVVGGAASATVTAIGDARVYRLQRQPFDALCAATPALLDTLARIAARHLQRRQMLAVLPALFGPLTAAELAMLEQKISWRTLHRGEVLFRQGEPGDAWYVVASGRLAVVEPAHDGLPERRLSEVGRGEGIGEMSLLTGQPRSATVYALRDAELARFPVEVVAELTATRPQLSLGMLRGLAQRITQQSSAAPRPHEASRTLALLPASPTVDLAGLARRLGAALSRFGATRTMGSAQLHEVGVGHEAAHRPPDHPTWTRLSAWLEEQSTAQRFVVLLADAEPNGWSQWTVGHADQVIVVGDARADPRPGPLERALLPASAEAGDVQRLLVLLHPDGAQPPRGTAQWLDARSVQAHLHLRLDRDHDIERLARRLAGCGVALALSGGGARCCAHIGAVRAMREHGLPIDGVAGTSAGALIGYLVAADTGHEAMSLAAQRFHEARPFKGYTLPLFSLLGGRRLSQALQAHCGDTRLEDLWLPLVAVSSNLTRRTAELHTRGPAWEALRASASLPGLVEPHIRDGELLVDGGLIDNLPVGVAREHIGRRVIAVDVTSELDLATTARAYPSPWTEFAARALRARGTAGTAPPGVYEVMMHSMLLASLAHTQRARLEAERCLRPDLAAFGLLALDKHARIIEAGYRYAQAHLAAAAIAPAD